LTADASAAAGFQRVYPEGTACQSRLGTRQKKIFRIAEKVLVFDFSEEYL
jgi:hypothetical protein